MLEDLRENLGRFTSSCDRYVKQAIDSGYFDQRDLKEWKQKAKNSNQPREERIKEAKAFLKSNYDILRNDPGRNGRYIVQSKTFDFDSHYNF